MSDAHDEFQLSIGKSSYLIAIVIDRHSESIISSYRDPQDVETKQQQWQLCAQQHHPDLVLDQDVRKYLTGHMALYDSRWSRKI